MTTAAATIASTRVRWGAALLVAGPLQFLAAHLIAQSAWSDPEYSWWNNYISDLGATTCGQLLGNVVCSPLHVVMNTGFVLQGILLALGITLTWTSWVRTRAGTAFKTMLLVTGASWVVVGLVPEDVDLTAHSVGALPLFVLGNAALLVAGTSLAGRGRGGRAALALGVLGVIGFALIVLTFVRPDSPIHIGAAERVAVFPHQAWSLAAGIGLLVVERRRRRGRRAARA